MKPFVVANDKRKSKLSTCDANKNNTKSSSKDVKKGRKTLDFKEKLPFTLKL